MADASEVHVKKIQRKRSGNSQKGGEPLMFPCANGSIKLAENGPNHLFSNPSRSYSNLDEDISRCLLGEDDGSEPAKEATSLTAVLE